MPTTVHVNTARTPEGFSLNPLRLTVHFTGNSPSLSIPDHLPIKISIHLPEGLSDKFTYSCQYLEDVGQTLVPELCPASFPFFPLPLTFNPAEGHCWQTLARQIEGHLIQAAQEHQGYILAREFFWMAFVAASPIFPFGDWPDWHPRISMSGDFIAYWITDHVAEEVTPESIMKVRQFIWDEFRTLAAYLLPFSIFPEEN